MKNEAELVWTRRWATASRYYRVVALHNLFGEWELLKAWGGIGNRLGGSSVIPVTTHSEALILMEEEDRRRARRGYLPTS
jgi:hypothetical protein